MATLVSLPGVTGFYAALNVLLFMGLSISVIVARLRRKQSIIGPRYTLLREQRAQANAAEYLPAFFLASAMLEMLGGTIVFVHIAGIFFTLGRVTHAAGVYASHDAMLDTGATPPWNPFRSFGAAITIVTIIATGFYLLGQSLSTWDEL